VLVGKAGAGSVNDLRKGRIYLPQQDSIYTYLARGLLTAHGLSFKDLNKVEYARYPQAGLVAINLRYSDATVVHRDDWDMWNKENPGATKILAESGGVPGGFSVAVKKDMSADTRNQLSKWFATSARSCGMKPITVHPDPLRYKRVAELGTFTPNSLPGVTVVAANDVKRLMNEGAVLVDTRNEKEFKQKHIPKAVFVPYHEKSLKDVAFDASLDDFKGLKSLNNKVPVVFHCNGPECWKSYKASRAALSAGFTKVYWYRGGMPDWEGTGQQIARE
jgi:rhodanese-related sulfurtransferase